MRVLELPKPLFPLNPVLAPQQPRIPRALGEVFVGNPRLKLPEVQAQGPKEPQAPKAEPSPAPKVEEPNRLGYTAEAKASQTSLGQQVDLRA